MHGASRLGGGAAGAAGGRPGGFVVRPNRPRTPATYAHTHCNVLTGSSGEFVKALMFFERPGPEFQNC